MDNPITGIAQMYLKPVNRWSLYVLLPTILNINMLTRRQRSEKRLNFSHPIQGNVGKLK